MIDLWVADIEAAGFVPYTAFEWLAPDERVRLERFRTGLERRRFLVSRLVLRNALARATGIDPAELRFHAVEEGGKPRLRTDGRSPDFNLSHSGRAVAVAVSSSHEVGVDVELLDETRMGRTALRLWTLKEAYAKMLGTGLECDLRELELPGEDSEVQLDYQPIRIGSEEYGLAVASRPLDRSSSPKTG